LPVPFADRPPTAEELERFRLILSTYQDGSGMLVVKNVGNLPGWRDFERTTAEAFGGIPQESKAIFDVLIPKPEDIAVYSGISCKMRGELNRIKRDGRVSLEISNSAGKFWDHLATFGITQANYKERPAEVGTALLDLIHQWHEAVSVANGGNIELDRSFYVSLMWNRKAQYQLHQFSLVLPNAADLNWHFKAKDELLGRSLRGDDDTGTVIEWYGESGAQLKYYPFAANAIWQSDIFTLEPLVAGDYSLRKKAAVYFPERWKATEEN
jgi:hypothetical protein